jgi:hypothetical protein
VVADLYLAGVSTRRVEKAVAQLGVESISKSQVSRLAGELDELVEAFRTREGNGHGNTLARTAAPRRPATPQLARPSSQTTAPSATERSGQAAMAAPIWRPSRRRRQISAVTKQVTDGGGGMPPFKGQLTKKQIDDVSAYVTKSITNKSKWRHLGRAVHGDYHVAAS